MVLAAIEVTERELLEGLLVLMRGWGGGILFLLQSHVQSRKHRKLHNQTPVLRKPLCPLAWSGGLTKVRLQQLDLNLFAAPGRVCEC